MNLLHIAAKKAMLDAYGWLSNTHKIVLLKSTYTYSSGHNNLSDVLSTHRVAISGALTTKTSTDGKAASDAALFTGPLVGTGTQAWLYKDSGSEATSTLIAFFDARSDGSPISIVGGTASVYLNVRGGIWFRI